MYIDPLERMKKIHIWIGFFSKGENEYEHQTYTLTIARTFAAGCLRSNKGHNVRRDKWKRKKRHAETRIRHCFSRNCKYRQNG